MRVIKEEIYTFEELSPEAQEKAIEHHRYYDADSGWWDYTYGDAEQIGLKITSFDTGRGNDITGHLIYSPSWVADLIIKNHGETCDTYKLATQFHTDWNVLVTKYSDGVDTSRVTEENEWEFDQDADELEKEFRRALLEEYLSMLRQEHEYLTSDEHIKELLADDSLFEFYKDGTPY